ncbi:MAG: hypothetical protein ACJ73S_17630 [Mycobacteriales bacterium]
MSGTELDEEYGYDTGSAAEEAVPATDSHPAGMVRLLPVMNFGMRAAALASLAVAVGGVAAAVSGMGHLAVLNDPDTTCCGGG